MHPKETDPSYNQESNCLDLSQCLHFTLPFFGVSDLTEYHVAEEENQEEDEHHCALKANRDQISICQLNTQSP